MTATVIIGAVDREPVAWQVDFAYKMAANLPDDSRLAVRDSRSDGYVELTYVCPTTDDGMAAYYTVNVSHDLIDDMGAHADEYVAQQCEKRCAIRIQRMRDEQ